MIIQVVLWDLIEKSREISPWVAVFFLLELNVKILPKECDLSQRCSNMGFVLLNFYLIYGFLISVRPFMSACAYTVRFETGAFKLLP